MNISFFEVCAVTILNFAFVEMIITCNILLRKIIFLIAIVCVVNNFQFVLYFDLQTKYGDPQEGGKFLTR